MSAKGHTKVVIFELPGMAGDIDTLWAAIMGDNDKRGHYQTVRDADLILTVASGRPMIVKDRYGPQRAATMAELRSAQELPGCEVIRL